MNHADFFTFILIVLLMGVVLYCVWRARRGRISYVRRVAGINAMEEAVGRATELGRPIVFIPGNSGIQAIETHTSMSVLAHVVRLAARMRAELVVLMSVPENYPLIEETMRQAYMAEGAPELFRGQEHVRFLSSDAVVFAAGVSRFVEEQRPGCVVFFGTFDFTSLLLAEPGARLRVLQIAGDPSLFQMPFFVCTCDYTVIGEEFYAAGALVSPDPRMRNSLLSQDLIKLVFAGVILFGLVLYHVLPENPAPGSFASRLSDFLKLLQSYK
jgi:hypothetical protein